MENVFPRNAAGLCSIWDSGFVLPFLGGILDVWFFLQLASARPDWLVEQVAKTL